MRRTKRARADFKISLFAFLDSQLCVLGALILLLVVVSTSNLRTRPPDPNAPKPEEIQAERELVELRIAQLSEQRDKTLQDLRERQLELGHLEAEAVRLRAQLEELARADEELKKQAVAAETRTQLEFELAQKQAEIARKRLTLEQLQRDLAGSPKSFAIIPYEGPNGTRRRPIYIECGPDAIILQPEGIALSSEDFEGPLGPGNPLAAAIRATREHLARKRRSSAGDSGEPYPFLLVRPDGIEAYWVAREALQSWNTDFGYELVDADWKLAYQPPDDELKAQVAQAVDVAREQQRLLAQMAPRSASGDRVFRANPTGGGVVAERSPGSRGGNSDRPPGMARGFGSGRASGHGGRGSAYASGDDGGLMPEDAPLAGGPGGQGGQEFGPGRDGSYGSPGGMNSDGQYTAGGNGQVNSAFGDEGPYFAGGPSGGQGRGEREGTNGPPANGARATGAAANGASSYGSGEPNNASQDAQMVQNGFARAGAGESNSAGGQPLRPGQSTRGSQSGAGGSPGAASSMATAGGGSPGAPAHHTASHAASMAQRRGENWGLPDEARQFSPIRRPVVLRCRGDAIGVVSSDGAERVSEWISFNGETEGSVDPLLSAVWKHIDSWGLAGNGLYWHPILLLDVQPDGEGRAADLEALLAGSGIDVRRRGAGRLAETPSGQKAR